MNLRRVGSAFRGIKLATAAALILGQLSLPAPSEAAPGSSSVSAGSAVPPNFASIQSFQPDLFTGRATTAVPIAVPPGRKGLQPSLALSYSSSARNGWVGVGWMLDMGYIERSTKNGVPSYTTSDIYNFFFQGVSSDLVQIPDGTYRAEDEGLFLKFTNNGVGGWEVRDKAGTLYRFGQTAASQIVDAGRIFRCALDQVIDVNGNSLSITYTKDQNQLYPAQIQYTRHVPTNLAPANQVDFVLETRPDSDTSHRSGFPITTAKRLKTIDTKATVSGALALARRYELAYTTSARTGRSLLTSITQKGTDGTTALPAETFTYHQATPPSYDLLSSGQSIPQLLTGDVDGNARTEFISFTASTGTWSVTCPYDSCSSAWTPGVWLTGFGTASSIPLLGDWNGDSQTDIGTYTNGVWAFALSTGTSFQAGSVSAYSLTGSVPVTGDWNGDGKTDLGVFTGGQWTFARGTGTGFTAASGFNFMSTAENNPLISDFNGDGLTDAGSFDRNGGVVIVYLSTGSGFVGGGWWITGFGVGQTALASGDFNGDGLTDFSYFNKPTGQIRWARSTGSSIVDAGTLPITFTQTTSNDYFQVGEVTGDALNDPIIVNAASGAIQIGRSAGTFPDVLSMIANGLGGSTTLTYEPSNQFDGTRLPFSTPGVRFVTLSDGQGNAVTTSYSYAGGVYDAPTKEFRGYAQAQVADAAFTHTTTWFHQDVQKKGRPYRTEVQDASGALWATSVQTWSSADIFPGVHVTKLDQSDSYVYDGDATVKQTRSRVQYDSYGNVTRVDADGDPAVPGDERAAVTTYTLNPGAGILGTPKLVQSLDAAGTVIAQRRFYYDGATSIDTAPVKGNLTKEEEWRNLPTVAWLATSLTYDTYGNVKTVTDALNRTTTNTYDTATSTYLTQIKNTLNHTRSFVYDMRLGAVLSTTDPNAVTTTTEYDALGRVTKVIGPEDTAALPTQRYVYDLTVQPAKTTVCARVVSGQSAELCTDAYTDGLGRTLQTRSPAEDPTKQVVSGAVELNALGQVTKQWTTYLDQVSTTYRPHTLVAGLAAPAQVTYDVLGRTLQVMDPDGAISRTAYSDDIVTVTDARNNQTRRTADVHGRLVKVEELNGASVYTTTYAYDAASNLTRVTDHAGNSTTMTYDSLGRKLSMTDPDMGTWSYEYDAVDNLTKQTDARTAKTTFTYDALNRLTQKSYTVVTGVTNPGSVTYTYDTSSPTQLYAKGKLVKVTDGSGSTSFIYDRLGRLTTETKAIGSYTYVVQRAYDALGQLTALTYPDTERALYTYNAQGGIETVQLAPATGAATTIVANMNYNAAGQLTKLVAGNGVITDYTFNPQTLRLDSLLTKTAGGVTIQDFSYGFDPVGNVTSLTDRLRTATQSFQYDPLNRLTQATGSYGAATYSYSPTGNLLTKEGLTLTYGGARPHAVTSLSDGRTLTYDANGNVVSKSALGGANTQTLTYDAENRLAEVAAGAGPKQAIYTYDGDGGRVKAVTGAGPTNTRFYVGELYETTININQPTKYVFAGSERLAAKAYDTGLRYYHSDHLGSSNVLTDATGNVVEVSEYRPFGTLSFHSGTLNAPHKFTGQRLDASTGFYFYHARYYDPELGRFLQADPTVQSPSDPQDLNRYAYCRNNPINLVDPSGYGFWKTYFIFAAAVAAIVATAGFATPAVLSTVVVMGTAEAVAGALIAAAPYAAAISIASGAAAIAIHNNSGTSSSAGTSLGERWTNVATNPAVAGAASFVAGLTPGAGEFQDYYAARYGVDFFTQQHLAGWEQGLSGAMLVLPLVGGVQARMAVRALNRLVAPKVTIIGENVLERVMPYAKKTGARIIEMASPEEWARMTPKQRYKINDRAIRTHARQGDVFESIGVDPRRSEALRTKFDLTRSELLRLDYMGRPANVVPASKRYEVLGDPLEAGLQQMN